jgi:hypothetical protein
MVETGMSFPGDVFDSRAIDRLLCSWNEPISAHIINTPRHSFVSRESVSLFMPGFTVVGYYIS